MYPVSTPHQTERPYTVRSRGAGQARTGTVTEPGTRLHPVCTIARKADYCSSLTAPPAGRLLSPARTVGAAPGAVLWIWVGEVSLGVGPFAALHVG